MTPISELERKIAVANRAYYTLGSSVVDDETYDQWKEELKQQDPNNTLLHQVGDSLQDDVLTKRTHSIRMGSQHKAANWNEFLAWSKQFPADTQFHATYKMDGGSASFEYQDGMLVAAITRGDGVVGEDITVNAQRFKQLPQFIKGFTGVVRAELILTVEDWESIDPDKTSNPRNRATGISRRKDGVGAELLSVYAFALYDKSGTPIYNTEEEQEDALQKYGFTTVKGVVGDLQTVKEFYDQTAQTRATLSFWIDGIVVKLNDVVHQVRLGESSNRPKGQIALKFPSESATTTLRVVVSNVGSTGAITPVASFDPVPIGGAQITNASLANWLNITELDIAVGDTIRVVKAGDIIPKIIEVLNRPKNREPIVTPTACPVCNGSVHHKTNTTGDLSVVIFCSNDSCPAKISGKIVHYLSKVNILGIGDNIVQTLIDQKFITSIADLYRLHLREKELAAVNINQQVKLGTRRARKIIEEIDQKKTLTLSEFIGSLGITGLGRRRVTLIQEADPGRFDNLENWLDDTILCRATHAKIPNLATAIYNDLQNHKQLIMDCIAAGVTIKSPTPVSATGPLICITGSLSKPKKEWQAEIEAKGFKYTDSLSPTVKYLVAADISSGSAKLKKAEKYGTTILDEEGLTRLLNNGNA